MAGLPPGLEQVRGEIKRRRNTPGGYVYVPGGVYPVKPVAGTGPQDVKLAPYYIKKTEVTNAEFKEFVDAGGYEDRSLWDEQAIELLPRLTGIDGSPGPGKWAGGEYPSGKGEHPVVEISLFEARAFARFKKARLPSREEWIVAAGYSRSGRNIRAFPWGDRWSPDLANLGAGSSGSSADAVGIHPLDISPAGCLDMGGNVTEWTDTPHPKGSGAVFVKGGSFRHRSEATVRILNDKAKAFPSMRWEVLGFRLVKDAPKKGKEGDKSVGSSGSGE
jgi:formylglycine-generating enzyme required for sulfatase activity